MRVPALLLLSLLRRGRSGPRRLCDGLSRTQRQSKGGGGGGWNALVEQVGLAGIQRPSIALSGGMIVVCYPGRRRQWTRWHIVRNAMMIAIVVSAAIPMNGRVVDARVVVTIIGGGGRMGGFVGNIVEAGQ